MHATKIHGVHTRITLQKTESNASPLVMKKKEWILRTDGETCGFSRSSQVSGLHNGQGCLGPWGWGLPWVRQCRAPQLGTLPSRSRAAGGYKELWALSISLGTRTGQDQARSSVCRSLSGSGLGRGTGVRHGPKMARHGPHPCSAVWGFCP